MEKVLLAAFILLLVLFIGNIFYNESFADCSAPGQMTWTITLGPGSSSCSSSGASGQEGGSSSSSSGGSSGESKRSVGRTYLDASGGLQADSVKSLGSASTSNSDSKGSSSTNSTKGSSASSSLINLSLTDLMALVGSSRDGSGNRAPAYNYRYASMSIPQPPAPPAPQIYILAGQRQGQAAGNAGQPDASLDSQFTPDLRTAAPIDPSAGYETSPNYQAIPASSYALRQGVNYVRGAPQANPAENPEYIRKDSIPCYACSL